MFEQRMNEYKNSVHPVEYYRQFVRSPQVAEEQEVNGLIIYKHGFFIRGGDQEGTVVEICPTAVSKKNYTYPGSCPQISRTLGLKLFINGDEVLSINEVPQEYEFWVPESLGCLKVITDLLAVGYLKKSYRLEVVERIIRRCNVSVGILSTTPPDSWISFPFDDGDFIKREENFHYWCLRKYTDFHYVTKYCKSPYLGNTETARAKVCVSDNEKDPLPVTFREVIDALS